ncbi:hypothetical protein AMAG_18669 [Allomyces macrogynus ATCC 38327]|uniref:F-box domain-containing protein n=1 Tax=Allomyces macrogynus (strain ATCC 38327) TaxID=578462 RepID=A0A0L0SGV3_ALLM3|nr:hypothetical protein AMAG_18669 [Allomyces macrogynus ATCC 38327]|eukprot:KNE61679.1 hypothetical protein AMAG_18669 [Allomyces macrogynus ATCC 38327]
MRKPRPSRPHIADGPARAPVAHQNETAQKVNFHDDKRAFAPRDPHPALIVPDIIALMFVFLNDTKDLFRAGHVCRIWQDTIMHSHASTLWPSLYRRVLGERYAHPPLESGVPSWRSMRRHLLTSAFRDRYDWAGLARLGSRIATAGRVKAWKNREIEVPLDHAHLTRQYVRFGTVIAHCPHLLGVGARSLVMVAETCVVFEPRVTGNAKRLLPRSFLQVQPFSTVAPLPPPFLLASGTESLEIVQNDGVISTNFQDHHFFSAGASRTKWACTASALRVFLYPQHDPHARIEVVHPDRLQVEAVSCCDDWLVVTYQAPTAWLADLLRNGPVTDLQHTPFLLVVYDLHGVRMPEAKTDRCARVAATEVGVKSTAVWVPYGCHLRHAVLEDLEDPFPIAVPATDPWSSPLPQTASYRRRLLKAMTSEKVDDGVSGHRLVVVTFDVTGADQCDLVAWQPYGVLPENSAAPASGEPAPYSSRGPCCSFKTWKMFGRILIGTPLDPMCCPRLQFARDDSGLDPDAAIPLDLKALLTNFAQHAFMAVARLIYDPLLHPLLRGHHQPDILARHINRIMGQLDDASVNHDDPSPSNTIFIQDQFCAASLPVPTAATVAAWSHHVLPAPLRIRATLPSFSRGPDHPPPMHVHSMHWTRRDRLVLVSRASVLPLAHVPHPYGAAVTTRGARIDVLDIAAMRIVATAALPPTTAYHIDAYTSNPAWYGHEETARSVSKEGELRRALFVRERGKLPDSWVIEPMLDAMRNASRGTIESVRRVVNAPGTVVAVEVTSRGIVLVRSLGPAAGAVVEVCTFDGRNLGPGLAVAMPCVERDHESK